ncbi:MAG: T9SS type A sorting domain-containing protein [Bacteroidales bacterium]|nr:T9SS type A sorting domain-containing protein [Bacteroidales bacterium]
MSNTMPVYSYWNYSWSSLIYNQSALGEAKSITKIGLNCTNGPKTVTNQKIYFKLSSNSTFAAANYEDPLNTGYTLGFQGDLTFQTGWNEITLLTPIPYDGIQNIIFHWENRWGTSYGPVFNSTASVINDNKNCGNDVNFPLPSQTGYLNPYPSSLANMRFYYAGSGPATPANPIPADNATVVSIATDLNWTLGANTTHYDLFFGTDPQNLPMVVNNAPAIPGVNTFTPGALLADSVVHYWKVIARNGSQQEVSPLWKFKTEVVIDEFPYQEGFEDSTIFHTYPVVSAWVIDPDVSWYEYSVNQHSGELCAKSSWYTYTTQAILRSPKVLLPPQHSISYYWQNSNINKVAGHDTTFFEVSTNGGLTWTSLDFLAPVSPNTSYQQRIHDLSAYAGNNFFFRFRHRTDTTPSAANIYLDDISIYQSGSSPSLLVTPSNQNVTAPAGTTQFSILSNSSWSAVSNQTWCSIASGSGSGNANLVVNYDENTSNIQRVANITVTVTGLPPVVVTVTQAFTVPTLSVTPPNQNVGALAGNTTFSVISSSAWTATSNQAWCSVTPSGSGNGNLVATYAENTSGSSRVAEIEVSAIGLPSVTVTVTQSESNLFLVVDPSNQNVPSTSGSTDFNISTNSAWTAVSDQSWCSVTPSGTGNGILQASYEANISLAIRIATITVSVSGLSPVTVTVTQNAALPFLGVAPPDQSVGNLSGTTNFSVSTNLNWTASSNSGWCAVTPSGSGNGTLFATYSENTFAVTRVAEITVSADGVSDVIVTVTQSGPLPLLTVAPATQVVNYQAGVASYAINSNTNWTAQTDADWCFPTTSGSGTSILNVTYLQNLTQNERQANISVEGEGIDPVVVQLIQLPFIVGVNNIPLSEIRLFPNPTKGNLTICSSASGQSPIAVELINTLGVSVYRTNLTDATSNFNLSSLSKGIYTIRLIDSSSKCFIKKLIIE